MQTWWSTLPTKQGGRHRVMSSLGSALALFLPKCPLCWVAIFGSVTLGGIMQRSMQLCAVVLFAVGVYALARRKVSSGLAVVLSVGASFAGALSAQKLSMWEWRLAAWVGLVAILLCLRSDKGADCGSGHCGEKLLRGAWTDRSSQTP